MLADRHEKTDTNKSQGIRPCRHTSDPSHRLWVTTGSAQDPVGRRDRDSGCALGKLAVQQVRPLQTGVCGRKGCLCCGREHRAVGARASSPREIRKTEGDAVQATVAQVIRPSRSVKSVLLSVE